MPQKSLPSAGSLWPVCCLLTLLIPSLAVSDSALRISDPHARAVPPGQPNSAVFMTIENASGQARALLSSSSPAAEVMELHTHIEEDGMMRMRPVERIELPAQGQVELRPGGLHLMLIGLRQTLEPETEIELTLTFDEGEVQALSVPVRALAPMSHAH